MAMTDEELSISRLSKGTFRGSMTYGTTLELWFSSPTGDSSDVVICKMECVSHDQAVEIAGLHHKAWGLSDF